MRNIDNFIAACNIEDHVMNYCAECGHEMINNNKYCDDCLEKLSTPLKQKEE